MAEKTKKHTKAWFVNRVGSEIAQYPISLFNPPIKIQSLSQAISLYITQSEKGLKYTEI